MRGPSLPGADGPANLLAAVQVVGEWGSAGARRAGRVQRRNPRRQIRLQDPHPRSPSAFQSRLTGPIGWLSEGHPVIAARPVGRFCLNVPSAAEVPPVALIRVTLGDDGRILPELAAQGFRGAVIEGFGGGHVTPSMVPRIERLATEMPVVLASRPGPENFCAPPIATAEAKPTSSRLARSRREGSTGSRHESSSHSVSRRIPRRERRQRVPRHRDGLRGRHGPPPGGDTAPATARTRRPPRKPWITIPTTCPIPASVRGR